MQYLVSVILDTADLATPDEQAAIVVFNDRLAAEGHWVFAGGLAAPSTATVIDNRGEKAMVTGVRPRARQRPPSGRRQVAGLIVVAVHRMPAAEVEVSAELVRRLLADQHPDLARLPVEFLANGWDNELYRVGDELVARLPRRALGAQIIKNEQRWLPGLAPRLPLPVPYPERIGVPGCGYPYGWSVVPYLPGVPAAQASSFDPGGAAAAVGGFLGALHVPAPADAPANPFRGVPLARRAGTFADSLALLTGQADQDQADWDAVRRVQDAALAAPRYDGPPAWLHGDLHPANILVNDGQVSGVIDFGDITAGDPASDLSVAWMLLPLDCHAAFWSAYQAAGGAGGRVDDALRVRARGWALNLAIVFLAHSEDNPVLREVGRRTLRTVLEASPPTLNAAGSE
ncbi:MAG TPA: aminoglycoside phosphotransferase family protein [Streptosporangiaceae bacterium]|nr:aminoglycoside phosphotransferase family protein [Streptosporangiaceae bacterium]